ncbi:MAG: Fe-S cluster protein [Deltaproteobacteria bacterium]|nr:MAG: Fe-S cluster protein [Deltaproteobacteria bacterium]
MNEIAIAGLVMTGIAGFFGVVLALANRFFRVVEDPRIDVVEGKLPGTNCGACGEPGCRSFAEALVKGASVPGKCTVSTPAAIEDVASVLGVDADFQEKRTARLHCAGGKSAVRRLADYQGESSCRAAFVVNGGGRACSWGCLGLGDCDVVCTFDAIHMNDEGLPVVDVEACTACGDCVDVCPLDLFTLEAVSTEIIVQCSSPLAGEGARLACEVACDACGRCALDAQEGAVEITGGLAVVRSPSRATEECTFRCPTGAIAVVHGDQFQEMELTQLRRSRHA